MNIVFDTRPGGTEGLHDAVYGCEGVRLAYRQVPKLVGTKKQSSKRLGKLTPMSTMKYGPRSRVSDLEPHSRCGSEATGAHAG
jgi:hypothetical protein